MPGGARSDGSGGANNGPMVRSPGYRPPRNDLGFDPEDPETARVMGVLSKALGVTFDPKQGVFVRTRYPDRRDVDQDARRDAGGWNVHQTHVYEEGVKSIADLHELAALVMGR